MNRSMLPDWPMIIAAVIGPTRWIVVSDPEGGAAGNHLKEQGLEPAAHLVLQPSQIAVALRQQLQDARVIIDAHRRKIVRA